MIYLPRVSGLVFLSPRSCNMTTTHSLTEKEEGGGRTRRENVRFYFLLLPRSTFRSHPSTLFSTAFFTQRNSFLLHNSHHQLQFAVPILHVYDLLISQTPQRYNPVVKILASDAQLRVKTKLISTSFENFLGKGKMQLFMRTEPFA